jgi:hypothetical protein
MSVRGGRPEVAGPGPKRRSLPWLCENAKEPLAQQNAFLSGPHETGQDSIRARQYASSKNLVLFILLGRAFLHGQDPLRNYARAGYVVFQPMRD